MFHIICLLLALSTTPPSPNKITVVAHRGDWRNAPENSLRAFTLAADMGVDMVELDLKKTKDGEIIILHDETLDRTTNTKGKPSDFTLAEIKTFHLRNGLGRVTNNTIPTLREVMTALKGKVMVNLDKSYPYYPEAFAILKETGTLQQAVFKSEVPYADLKAKYGSLIDSIIYMPVVDLDKPTARPIIEDYLKNMHPYAFELNFKTDTSSILKDNAFIRSTGTKVWMNSLWASLNAGHEDDRAVEEGDTTGSWDWLISHGATVIQTDRPAQLLQYLRSKKLHK
ncbi:MAG: glycerophosphodiester phosphodiesterase family protein [Bacteroidetes bacterium]|nr:glycerophosphodiester phosphodiesterase family protein [Bacteroidota bacterium]